MNMNLLFGIIFAIIIMMAVLFFGVGQFGNLTDLNTQTAFYNQINDFESAVKKTAEMSMGSTQKFDFNIPSTMHKICFIDRNNPESNSAGNWELTNINEKLITDYDYNFFIYETETKSEGKKINYLIPLENFCIKGKKTLWLENKGRYVTISE